jgi:hypothetical protein
LKQNRRKLEKEKEREGSRAVREPERMGRKAGGEDNEEVGPKTPARQSGIPQPPLQASDPEDSQKNETVFQEHRGARTTRMGAPQAQNAAAENGDQRQRQQESYASHLPVQD